MGSGIAQVAAVAGFTTIQYDVAEPMLQKSSAAMEAGLHMMVQKGKLTEQEASAAAARISYTTQFQACVADIIIEAIAERLDIKQELFNKLAGINSAGCILASNTSSLSISQLQQGIAIPGRVAGMHFFNPAPVMQLVEIVKGKQSTDSTINLLYDLAKAMGKTPVHCQDAPGFIVNHVARPYYLNALRMVEEGLCTPQQADDALRAAGFKMGPFALMDLIGIDINYKASHQVWQDLGRPSRLQPSGLQAARVEAGKLGRKTGEGFYTYEQK